MSRTNSIHGSYVESVYRNGVDSVYRSRSPSLRSFSRSPVQDPFGSPSSRSIHSIGNALSSDISSSRGPQRQRKFKSSRLQPGEYDEKPWVKEKNPRRKWERIIFWSGILVGLLGGAVQCYVQYSSVSNFQYCPVMDENFSNGIDEKTWNYEIQRGGFGSGSFEWTTRDPKNIYTDAMGLHIIPTLTTETSNITVAQITDNYVLNLTTAGTCTAKTNLIESCSIRSNKTAGTIINPVRSARINTMGKKTIRYGRVEVTAKLPKGDWLWPAIWMMPNNNSYGPWPASGEIDIMESRGNAGYSYPDGRDSVISALHWGPIPVADAFFKTAGKHNVRRTDYSDSFHTYGLEWSEKYIFMYIDSRLLQVLYVKFNKPMWDKGGFGEAIVNHTALTNPWSATNDTNAPFDQDFYLILNVAVGGTNGFFTDGIGNKPWADASPTAQLTFWNSEAQWLPTWGEGDTRGLTVSSVKMWSQGACGSTPPKQKRRFLW